MSLDVRLVVSVETGNEEIVVYDSKLGITHPLAVIARAEWEYLVNEVARQRRTRREQAAFAADLDAALGDHSSGPQR